MALNDTVKHMRELLAGISVDLEKAVGGNKAASQRVRTSTIRLEKVAKNFRRESISAEKHGGMKKQKKSAAAKKPAKAKAQAKPQPKAKAKAKAPAKKPMMMKRPTAKIPVKKA